VATLQEQIRETASMGRALGDLPADANPAQEQAYFDSKTDLEIYNMAVAVYARLGADGYRHNAAA